MNNPMVRTTLALGMVALALSASPAKAERYIVEPITDGSYTTETLAFSQAELDQMLAPIALYPDSLLSQVLIAATYPLEVVEAARWSRQNPHLKGEDAVTAAANRGWDPSVHALVAFPEILAQMDEDLEWTRRLGDAMLYQETQVMDSVQFLRARADSAGHLEDTEYVRVIREEKTIVIQPTQPRVVYVPYYDPWVVYGSWWRPAYPPVVWARPSFYYYGHSGFHWGPAVHVSPGFFYTGFYWPQRTVVIVNTPRYYSPPRHRGSYVHHAPGQRWTHNPAHRRGVSYRHKEVRERYQQPALRGDRPRSADRGDGARGTSRPANRQAIRTPERTYERTYDRSTGSVRDRSAQDRGEAPRLSAGPRTNRPTISGTQEQLQRQARTPSRSASATTRTVPQTPQAGASHRSPQTPIGARGTGSSRAPQASSPSGPRQAAPPSRAPQASGPSRAPQAARQAPAPASRAAPPPAQNRGNASSPRSRSGGRDAGIGRGQDRREID